MKALISIAGPFGGSGFAVWPLTWVSASVKQMRKNSDFLVELHKKN